MRKLLPIILVAAVIAAGFYIGRARFVREVKPVGPVLTIACLDATLGNAIVVKTPENYFMVVDPGPANTAGALVRYLEDAGAKSLVILLSKSSSDHTGAISSLLDSFTVSKIIHGEYKAKSSLVRRTLTSVIGKGAIERISSAGDVFNISPTTKLEVLSPPKGLLKKTGGHSDNNSLVTRIHFGGKRFLLASDIRLEAEANLIQSGVDLRSSVLVVPRHGRYGGTSLELLSVVRPEAYVVLLDRSSNRASRAVLERIDTRNTGAAVYRTDLDGNIEMITDGRSIKVNTSGSYGD